jgi:hypothetical protein
MPRVTSVSWTPEQLEQLQQLVSKGASAARAAAALRRSMQSVKDKARHIGLPFPRRKALRARRQVPQADAAN